MLQVAYFKLTKRAWAGPQDIQDDTATPSLPKPGNAGIDAIIQSLWLQYPSQRLSSVSGL